MRQINVEEITNTVRDMCISVNYELSGDMKNVLCAAAGKEESPLGRQILEQLKENMDIAKEDMIPICQDTGMAVIFIEIGQDVHFVGGSLEAAINEGVRRGYTEVFLVI